MRPPPIENGEGTAPRTRRRRQHRWCGRRLVTRGRAAKKTAARGRAVDDPAPAVAGTSGRTTPSRPRRPGPVAGPKRYRPGRKNCLFPTLSAISTQEPVKPAKRTRRRAGAAATRRAGTRPPTSAPEPVAASVAPAEPVVEPRSPGPPGPPRPLPCSSWPRRPTRPARRSAAGPGHPGSQDHCRQGGRPGGGRADPGPRAAEAEPAAEEPGRTRRTRRTRRGAEPVEAEPGRRGRAERPTMTTMTTASWTRPAAAGAGGVAGAGAGARARWTPTRPRKHPRPSPGRPTRTRTGRATTSRSPAAGVAGAAAVTGADTEAAADDGVVTVVRVRQPRAPRDEVQGVTGSTRLEAKRQRRRDGRQQRRTRPPCSASPSSWPAGRPSTG